MQWQLANCNNQFRFQLLLFLVHSKVWTRKMFGLQKIQHISLLPSRFDREFDNEIAQYRSSTKWVSWEAPHNQLKDGTPIYIFELWAESAQICWLGACDEKGLLGAWRLSKCTLLIDKPINKTGQCSLEVTILCHHVCRGQTYMGLCVGTGIYVSSPAISTLAVPSHYSSVTYFQMMRWPWASSLLFNLYCIFQSANSLVECHKHWQLFVFWRAGIDFDANGHGKQLNLILVL